MARLRGLPWAALLALLLPSGAVATATECEPVDVTCGAQREAAVDAAGLLQMQRGQRPVEDAPADARDGEPRDLSTLQGEPAEQGGRLLSASELQRCSFEVVMFDTRDLTDEPVLDGELAPDHYWSLTAVLNYAYAKRHGYRFRWVHLDKQSRLTNYSVVWHRVFYFKEQLAALHGPASCSWLLHLDTDSFVREFQTDLPAFVEKMAHAYGIRDDVGVIFSQEQSVPGHFHSHKRWINAGIYLIQVNAQAQLFFDKWQSAAADVPAIQHRWPAEHGVLTEMAFPGQYITAPGHARLRDRGRINDLIALVNMTEMNSPWGRFIEHAWSGIGREHRKTDFLDALKKIDAADPDVFHRLLAEVRQQHVVAWSPKDVTV